MSAIVLHSLRKNLRRVSVFKVQICILPIDSLSQLFWSPESWWLYFSIYISLFHTYVVGHRCWNNSHFSLSMPSLVKWAIGILSHQDMGLVMPCVRSIWNSWNQLCPTQGNSDLFSQSLPCSPPCCSWAPELSTALYFATCFFLKLVYYIFVLKVMSLYWNKAGPKTHEMQYFKSFKAHCYYSS